MPLNPTLAVAALAVPAVLLAFAVADTLLALVGRAPGHVVAHAFKVAILSLVAAFVDRAYERNGVLT